MAEESSVRNISVAEWHALAQQNVHLPVRITVNGWSMQPLIRKGRDFITILPVRSTPIPGDIVLFSDPSQVRYVVHRVWDTSSDRILTWGDNCINPDGWLPQAQIWGIAVQVERGRRKISFETANARKWGLRLARITHAVCRLRQSAYSVARRLPAPIRRGIKRLLGFPSPNADKNSAVR